MGSQPHLHHRRHNARQILTTVGSGPLSTTLSTDLPSTTELILSPTTSSLPPSVATVPSQKAPETIAAADTTAPLDTLTTGNIATGAIVSPSVVRTVASLAALFAFLLLALLLFLCCYRDGDRDARFCPCFGWGRRKGQYKREHASSPLVVPAVPPPPKMCDSAVWLGEGGLRGDTALPG